MRLPAPSAQPPDLMERSIGPLVDVVFLLVLFFLLAGTLAPPDPIPVTPPESTSGEERPPARLRVLLDPEGRIGFEGRVLDLAGLEAALAPRIGEGPRSVWIEADGDAAAGTVLALIARLRALGLDELALVARRGALPPPDRDDDRSGRPPSTAPGLGAGLGAQVPAPVPAQPPSVLIHERPE